MAYLAVNVKGVSLGTYKTLKEAIEKGAAEVYRKSWRKPGLVLVWKQPF